MKNSLQSHSSLTPKRTTLSLVLSSLVSFILLSCGLQDSSDLAESTPPRKKPLVVVMGGFSSCTNSGFHDDWETPVKMAMWNDAQKIIQQVESEFGLAADVFTSCFTKLAEIRYASSDDQYKKLHTEQSVSQVISAVMHRLKRYDHVYFVGHSYGGWLAMKTLLSIGQHDNHPQSRVLFTLDPISRKHCRLENPFGWGSCVSAPEDFDKDAQWTISQATIYWFNAWQKKTSFLHSSSIPMADENKKFNVQHWDINGLAGIWAAFHHAIRSDLLDKSQSKPQMPSMPEEAEEQLLVAH